MPAFQYFVLAFVALIVSYNYHSAGKRPAAVMWAGVAGFNIMAAFIFR
jgi:hypothetical protein